MELSTENHQRLKRLGHSLVTTHMQQYIDCSFNFEKLKQQSVLSNLKRWSSTAAANKKVKPSAVYWSCIAESLFPSAKVEFITSGTITKGIVVTSEGEKFALTEEGMKHPLEVATKTSSVITSKMRFSLIHPDLRTIELKKFKVPDTDEIAVNDEEIVKEYLDFVDWNHVFSAEMIRDLPSLLRTRSKTRYQHTVTEVDDLDLPPGKKLGLYLEKRPVLRSFTDAAICIQLTTEMLSDQNIRPDEMLSTQKVSLKFQPSGNEFSIDFDGKRRVLHIKKDTAACYDYSHRNILLSFDDRQQELLKSTFDILDISLSPSATLEQRIIPHRELLGVFVEHNKPIPASIISHLSDANNPESTDCVLCDLWASRDTPMVWESLVAVVEQMPLNAFYRTDLFNHLLTRKYSTVSTAQHADEMLCLLWKKADLDKSVLPEISRELIKQSAERYQSRNAPESLIRSMVAENKDGPLPNNRIGAIEKSITNDLIALTEMNDDPQVDHDEKETQQKLIDQKMSQFLRGKL